MELNKQKVCKNN